MSSWIGLSVCALVLSVVGATYPPGACRAASHQHDMRSCFTGDWLCQWCDLTGQDIDDDDSIIDKMRPRFEVESGSGSEEYKDATPAPAGFPFRCARRWTRETCPGTIYYATTLCESKYKALLTAFDDAKVWREKLDSASPSLRSHFSELYNSHVQLAKEAKERFDEKCRGHGKETDPRHVRSSAQWAHVSEFHVEENTRAEEEQVKNVANRYVASVIPFPFAEDFPAAVCNQWQTETGCAVAGCSWCDSEFLGPAARAMKNCQPSWTEDLCRTGNTRRGAVVTAPHTPPQAAWNILQERGWYPVPGEGSGVIADFKSTAQADLAAATAALGRFVPTDSFNDHCKTKFTLGQCLEHADDHHRCAWCMDPIDATQARCSKTWSSSPFCYSPPIPKSSLGYIKSEFAKAYKEALPPVLLAAEVGAGAAAVVAEVREASVRAHYKLMAAARKTRRESGSA